MNTARSLNVSIVLMLIFQLFCQAAYNPVAAQQKFPDWMDEVKFDSNARQGINEPVIPIDPATGQAAEQRPQVGGEAQDVDAEPEPDHGLPVDEAGHVQTWADVLRLQEQGVEPAAFEAVTCPVLMLHGAEDPHPGQLVRDTLRRHVRHLEYVEFPRCGHSPWRERAARESFHTVLVEWLLR